MSTPHTATIERQASENRARLRRYVLLVIHTLTLLHDVRIVDVTSKDPRRVS